MILRTVIVLCVHKSIAKEYKLKILLRLFYAMTCFFKFMVYSSNNFPTFVSL